MSIENPPRPKKISSDYAPTSLDGEVLKLPHAEAALQEAPQSAPLKVKRVEGYTPIVLSEPEPVVKAEKHLVAHSDGSLSPFSDSERESIDRILADDSKKEVAMKLRSLVQQVQMMSQPANTEEKAVPAPNRFIKGLHLSGAEEAPQAGRIKGAGHALTDAAIGRTESRKSIETVQEHPHEEGAQVKSAVELAKRSGVEKEREAMGAAEAKYLSAYKDFYTKNNVLERLGKKHGIGAENTEVAKFKNAYDASRLDYAKKLQSSVKDRLEKGEKTGIRTADHSKLLERYNASIRYREIVKPALEKQNQARLEALSTKEKGVLETFAKGTKWGAGKFLEWNANLTKGIESKLESQLKAGILGKKFDERRAKVYAKYGARAVRLLGTTAAFSTAGLLSGGLAYGAVGVYAGSKILKGGLSMIYGSVGGATFGKVYAETGGKRAAEELRSAPKNEIKKLDDLRAQERAYTHGTKEAIERKRALVETASAALISFGYSFEQAHVLADQHHVQAAAERMQHLNDEMKSYTKFEHLDQELKDFTHPAGVHEHHGLSHAPSHHEAAHHEAAMHAVPHERQEAPKVEHHESHHHHKPVHTSHHRFPHHPHAAASQDVPASTPVSGLTVEEIQKYEVEHNGLAPGSDKHIEDVVRGSHEQAPADTTASVESTPTPKPVEAPAAEQAVTAPPEHVEAPTPASEHEVPVHIETNTFTNSHHLEIHPAKAELFEEAKGKTVVFGGTFEERYAAARAFAKSHSEATVYFDASYKDPLTGVLHEKLGGVSHSSEVSGVADIPGTITDNNDNDIPVPKADDLVKRIS